MITEKLLQELKWNDFAIMDFKDGKIVLIFLVESSDKANRLRELFYDFDLKVYVNQTTKIVTIGISFNNSEFNIGYDTGRTAKDYFPLTWLLESKVNYLTTGFKDPDGQIHYNKNLYKLEMADL
jgi:hypothetical protein